MSFLTSPWKRTLYIKDQFDRSLNVISAALCLVISFPLRRKDDYFASYSFRLLLDKSKLCLFALTYQNLTIHSHGNTVYAHDIVNLLICLTFVNKCISLWYFLYPCSFSAETDLYSIPKEHIVMDQWIGFRWVASEIHPHVIAAIVLCCISFQSDIIWLNWRNKNLNPKFWLPSK